MRSFHARCCALLFSFALTLAGTNASAQCTWYTITVTDGNGAPDVTWELIDQFGVTGPVERPLARGHLPARRLLTPC
ncbi:MAG: hypothetical protein IPN38_11595 [Flavobacteriales bacterium]|nr:hypothetical protein [Flavobacteriales bacterium]